jgi:integrase
VLALNGLRVSEAIGADIEQLGMEWGHRTLAIMQKGGKVVTIPLAPRTARRSTRRSACGHPKWRNLLRCSTRRESRG